MARSIISLFFVTMIVILALLTGVLTSCGQKAPKISVENVFSRPAVVIEDKMGGMGVVYLTLVNAGSVPDRLIRVQSAVANKAEVHEASIKNGRPTMQAVEGGLEIPAKGRIEFRSGGYHIMLMRLKRNLEAGDRFEVVLEFEKSGTMTVESEVRQP